jgi:phosphoenolpyruvate carboxykinase (GTP)
MSPTPLEAWVDAAAALTQPAKVVWCDGSAREAEELSASMVRNGSLVRLNPETYPDCYLYRSNPSDVARTEHLTFICTARKDDADPRTTGCRPPLRRRRLVVYFAQR